MVLCYTHACRWHTCMHTHMHKIPNSFGGISEVRWCFCANSYFGGRSVCRMLAGQCSAVEPFQISKVGHLSAYLSRW